MKTKTLALLGAPLAVGAAALIVMPGSAGAASGTNYQATLNPLNHSTASGSFSLQLNGNQATITEHVSGLAASFGGKPYPHVQHIHIDGMGMCPTAAADKNADGVVSTTEGAPQYGPIGTTLSTSGDTSPKAGTTLTVAPSGADFTYSRTITLDSKTHGVRDVRQGRHRGARSRPGDAEQEGTGREERPRSVPAAGRDVAGAVWRADRVADVECPGGLEPDRWRQHGRYPGRGRSGPRRRSAAGCGRGVRRPPPAGSPELT